MKIIRYLILHNLMWLIATAMCYLDCMISDINYDLQDFLITLFEVLAWLTLVVGAINTFPEDKYSNKRVWFYSAIMGGSLYVVESFIRLIGTIKW